MACRKALLITGGIGSGKSLVSSFLAELGWAVVDADRIGHEVLNLPEVVGRIAAYWPEAVSHREVDRATLGSIVFSDVTELERLEQLVHPIISDRIEQWLQAQTHHGAVEISVASMVKKSWGPAVVVDSPTDVRMKRIVSRDRGSGNALARMNVQPLRGDWLRLADVVIENAGSVSDLRKAVHRLVTWVDKC